MATHGCECIMYAIISLYLVWQKTRFIIDISFTLSLNFVWCYGDGMLDIGCWLGTLRRKFRPGWTWRIADVASNSQFFQAAVNEHRGSFSTKCNENVHFRAARPDGWWWMWWWCFAFVPSFSSSCCSSWCIIIRFGSASDSWFMMCNNVNRSGVESQSCVILFVNKASRTR